MKWCIIEINWINAVDLTPAKLVEPWFDDNNLEAFNGVKVEHWSKDEEIRFNQIRRQRIKWEFYQGAFDFINENGIDGGYHEFGCHRARTFRMALIEAKRHFMEMEFHAYDSFEGLPECQSDLQDADVENWQAGMLSTSEEEFKKLIFESGLHNDKIRVHVGFYSESLKAINKDDEIEKQAAMICIDCDLYESAVDVYKYIDSLLQEGTLIYVDDYYAGYKGNPKKGVSKAQREWLENSEWKLEPFLTLGTFGKSFICYK